MISENIPIQNIYYMLSYAYENLKINKNVLKESADFKNIYDLFARILINVMNTLIKRGFYKQYILKTENTSSPKGKINITNTIKEKSYLNKKLNCQYNDFNENVLFNQILKTSINNLIKIKDLNRNLKKKLKKFNPFLTEIKTIKLNKQTFKKLIWNKNNSYYNLAITICELIYLYQIPEDKSTGKIIFKDFVKKYEKELSNLFENFVYNFYKKELNKINEDKIVNIKVHKPKIKWNLNQDFENIGISYLPNMRTDIVLENKKNQLIIDTKFYKNILSKFYEKESLNSANLYQIATYINNSDFDGRVNGMLLYASTNSTHTSEDINYQFKINDSIIYIKTINLNQSWEEIERRLIKISRLLYENCY